jgi:chemotaxis response regulator CheB
MAFVIVQHLDPNRESILADLLQRHTAMHVV